MGDFGCQMNVYFPGFFDFSDEIGQFLLNAVTGSRAVDITGLAAQAGIFFDDVGFISLARQASGRGHAGDAPADHHGGRIDFEFGLF